MNRIDKNRKGVVFGLMTDEERQCIANQKNIIFFCAENEWLVKDEYMYEHRQYNTSVAYWCPDWDEPTGEELVGKLCWVCDFGNIPIRVLRIIINYTDGVYDSEGTSWATAKLASKEDALKLVTI